jgi:hypothetical protein
MQEEGLVSLWVGRAESADALDAYVQEAYTDDGDFASAFATDFGIEYYDEDFREAHYHVRSSRSVRDLLKGHSYEEVIIPRFVDSVGESSPEDVNAVILLYNFKHDSGVRMHDGGAVKMQFLGTVAYH